MPEGQIVAGKSEGTWPQHMCCALVTPSVPIYRDKKGNPKKTGMMTGTRNGGEARMIFKLELHNTRAELYMMF